MLMLMVLSICCSLQKLLSGDGRWDAAPGDWYCTRIWMCTTCALSHSCTTCYCWTSQVTVFQLSAASLPSICLGHSDRSTIQEYANPSCCMQAYLFHKCRQVCLHSCFDVTSSSFDNQVTSKDMAVALHCVLNKWSSWSARTVVSGMLVLCWPSRRNTNKSITAWCWCNFCSVAVISVFSIEFWLCPHWGGLWCLCQKY